MEFLLNIDKHLSIFYVTKDQKAKNNFIFFLHFFHLESWLKLTCHKDVYGKFVTIARSRSVINVSLGLCEVHIYGEVNLDIGNNISYC